MFIPTFNVEPVEDIEHTAGISKFPTAEIEAGPRVKETALIVSSGAIAKVAEADRVEIAPISTTAEDACVAVEERDAMPNLSTVPALETDPEQLKEETPTLVTMAEEETEPAALREQEPRCVWLTSGIVERGNSLIAPKPSITPPYLQCLTNPAILPYNIYTLIFSYQSTNIINAAPVVSASATNSCAPISQVSPLESLFLPLISISTPPVVPKSAPASTQSESSSI